MKATGEHRNHDRDDNLKLMLGNKLGAHLGDLNLPWAWCESAVDWKTSGPTPHRPATCLLRLPGFNSACSAVDIDCLIYKLSAGENMYRANKNLDRLKSD